MGHRLLAKWCLVHWQRHHFGQLSAMAIDDWSPDAGQQMDKEEQPRHQGSGPSWITVSYAELNGSSKTVFWKLSIQVDSWMSWVLTIFRNEWQLIECWLYCNGLSLTFVGACCMILMQALRLNMPYIRDLENCIQFGTPVLLENVEESLDAILDPVLQKATFKQGTLTMVRLGDSTIEWSKDFKWLGTGAEKTNRLMPFDKLQVWVMNLTNLSHTVTLYSYNLHRLGWGCISQRSFPNPHFPPEICVAVSILNFMATQESCCLLRLFLGFGAMSCMYFQSQGTNTRHRD